MSKYVIYETIRKLGKSAQVSHKYLQQGVNIGPKTLDIGVRRTRVSNYVKYNTVLRIAPVKFQKHYNSEKLITKYVKKLM